MPAKTTHMVLFKEENLDHAAEAVERLHELGVEDKDISVISGVPFSDKMLGRPMAWTRIGVIGMAGAVVGFLAGAALSLGTPYLYPIRVGGQPFYPIPTSIVVIFELTMLGLLISTFLGVAVEMLSPSYGPKGYDPKISDGRIGVLFSWEPMKDDELKNKLNDLEPEWVNNPEARR